MISSNNDDAFLIKLLMRQTRRPGTLKNSLIFIYLIILVILNLNRNWR